MCSIQFSPAGLLAGGGSAITDKNRSDDATEEARLVVSTSLKGFGCGALIGTWKEAEV